MTRGKALRLVLLAGVTALMLSYPPLYTPWWVVVWALVALVAVLAEAAPHAESTPWWARRGRALALAPERQLALSLLLVVATAVGTRWQALGWRDVVLWAWVVFTLAGNYGGGLRWAWERLQAVLGRDA
jgi:hypothetical protein